jgi:hypothetical protein
MSWNDIVNALFELVGAYFTWRNYFQLLEEREVKGVYWPTTAFFTAWGLWNIFYYPSLGQWFSFGAGLLLVGGNFYWVVLVLQLKYRQRLPRRFDGK